MQSVARLEAQIEKELLELNRIQETLHHMQAEKGKANLAKENLVTEKTSLSPKPSTKFDPVKKEKSIQNFPPPKEPNVIDKKKSETIIKSTKKMTIQPQNMSQKENIRPKITTEIQRPENDVTKTPVLDKKPATKASQKSLTKKPSDKSSDFVHLESFKDSFDGRKESLKGIHQNSLIIEDMLEDHIDHQKSIERHPDSRETISKQDADLFSPLKLSDLLQANRTPHKDRISIQQKRNNSKSKTPTKQQNKDKSVIELGHEQLEKLYHQFREARKRAKTFEERVNLMVLEVR